MIRVVEVLSAH